MKLESSFNYRISLSERSAWTQILHSLLRFEDLFSGVSAQINDERKIELAEENLDEMYRRWQGQEYAEEDDAFLGSRHGSMVIESKRHELNVLMMWKMTNPEKAKRLIAAQGGVRFPNPVNAIVIQAATSWLETRIERFLELFQLLIRVEGFVYADCFVEGRLRRLNQPKILDEYGLPVPGWLLALGAPHVELIGRDRLLKTPCFEVKALEDGSVLLRLNESLVEDRAASRRVMAHLGKQYFDRGIFRRAKGFPEIDYRRTFYSS